MPLQTHLLLLSSFFFKFNFVCIPVRRIYVVDMNRSMLVPRNSKKKMSELISRGFCECTVQDIKLHQILRHIIFCITHKHQVLWLKMFAIIKYHQGWDFPMFCKCILFYIFVLATLGTSMKNSTIPVWHDHLKPFSGRSWMFPLLYITLSITKCNGRQRLVIEKHSCTVQHNATLWNIKSSPF